MAPGMGFEVEAGQSKRGRVPPPNLFNYAGPWNPPFSSATSPKRTTGLWPKASVSPLSSTTSLNSPTVNTKHNHSFRAPDSKALESKQHHLQDTLTEATKRAAVAERKAAEYLQAKDNAERQLSDHRVAKAALATANQRLIAENQSLKDEYQKLEKHTKNCEKATNKAQKEAKNAKGHADHLINSQKGQLKSAERRYEDAARELKEWRDRYGWSVEKPADEMAALQRRLSEWQSKAEKAQNEVVALKGGLQGQQGSIEVEENQSSIKVEEDPSSTKAEENPVIIKAEEYPTGYQASANQIIAAAEAQVSKHKEERDALYRMLQEEMARNAKLAESLVLRNARLADSLGWAADDGEI